MQETQELQIPSLGQEDPLEEEMATHSWPASWEICMQVKKQQSELDTEQQTGSKLGKKYVKAVYCYPAENIMWNSRLDEAQAGIKIARRNINNLRYADDITLWQKVKRN